MQTGKGPVLAIALLTRVRLVFGSASQSRKWQLMHCGQTGHQRLTGNFVTQKISFKIPESKQSNSRKDIKTLSQMYGHIWRFTNMCRPIIIYCYYYYKGKKKRVPEI